MDNSEQVKNFPSPTMDLAEVNKQLQASLAEQQRVSQMVIQKDLELSKINDQLNRQLSQLQVLQAMMDEIRVINKRKQTLNIIARGLVIELQFASVVIFLGDFPFTLGIKYSYKEINIEHLQQHPLLHSTYQTGLSSVIYNIDQGSPDQQKLGNILHLNSFCILPLRVRRKYYGLFICGFDDPYQKLNEEDMEFLEIVANSIATTLESLEVEKRQRYIDSVKSEFISIASHQLRTPLSAIKWSLRMLVDGDLGKLSSEQKHFLEKTYKSNERMINLVNDLLDVSRIEEGRLEYKFNKFNLSVLLKEILDQYRVLIVKKRLVLKTNIADGEQIMILGDHEKLSLAFNNLIDNAIKFTPKGGSISVLVEPWEDQVQIKFADSGIGISQEDQKRLFTKFFRSDDAKRLQTEGTGLGLFITRNIIRKHNGKIKIESESGKGTTVICSLPR